MENFSISLSLLWGQIWTPYYNMGYLFLWFLLNISKHFTLHLTEARLQSSLESKSKQDSCVWPVTKDSSWHLDLKVQDMNITTKSDCNVVLNQRANRIHVCGLWQEIHFDSWIWNCRTWIITTKSDCKVVLNQGANRILVWGLWKKI